MREKRRGERSKAATPILTYRAEEILIAKNRNLSPLVLSFIYEPENIALQDLGTLFGTFIVTDHHEDSSYIVNCLAAAAKKEYFINSRRAVEESFESTLNKINLTLGKLVRDGHINWMGKLHGSVIAIHNRKAYFSVTGEATILLLRNNILSAISEGLADPEAAMHPLKTFTDISEGSLLTGDKIILSTPELLELLPHALLEREAAKLPIDRFAQLLKTALINERPAAATILIDFSEAPVEDIKSALRIAKKTKGDEEGDAPQPFIENIFSNQPFQKYPEIEISVEIGDAEQKDIPLHPNAEQKEHIDNRTGHIYIQADASMPPVETETAIDRILVILKEEVLILSIKIKKHGRKYAVLLSREISHAALQGLQLLIRLLRTTSSFLAEKSRDILQKMFLLMKGAFSRSASIRNISFTKKNPEALRPSLSFYAPETAPPSFFSKPTAPKTPPSRPQPAALKYFSSFLSATGTLLGKINHAGFTLWQTISKKRKFAFIAMIASFSLIGAGIIFIQSQSSQAPIEETIMTPPEPALPPFPPANEPLAREVSLNELFSTNSSESPILPILLKDKLFVLTRRNLINTENSLSLSLPEAVLPIRKATAMNDLNAIFIYGQDKKMYIYYPNAKSLVENTFPIPDTFTMSDMGTYLTYLYAFDAKQGRILRFPRAEGGFGAPLEWLKENISFDENARMSIGENIFIGSKDTVFSFTKGKGGAVSLAHTETPMNIRDIAVTKDGSSFFVLDEENKRIVQFDMNGELTAQYFGKQLSESSEIILSSDGTTLSIGTPHTLLSFSVR